MSPGKVTEHCPCLGLSDEFHGVRLSLLICGSDDSFGHDADESESFRASLKLVFLPRRD